MALSSDAAEQMIRLSIEGARVAVRVTGKGASRLGSIMNLALNGKNKTRGKTRIKTLLRSGRELKVYQVKAGDLKVFSREARKYGILYCAIKDKEDKSDSLEVDIIVRNDDAAKIERVIDRFGLGSERNNIDNLKNNLETKDLKREFMESLLMENMTVGKEEFLSSKKKNLSERELKGRKMATDSLSRPSVKEAINRFKREGSGIEDALSKHLEKSR